MLGARGEKVRDLGFAAIVDDFEAAAAGLGGFMVSVWVRMGVGGGLVLEEGLRGRDFVSGGWHCERGVAGYVLVEAGCG